MRVTTSPSSIMEVVRQLNMTSTDGQKGIRPPSLFNMVERMVMAAVDGETILRDAYAFFEDVLAANHLRNTKKLAKLSSFKINPFTVYYLSAFAFGDISAESLAKTLVYPRALGTSISTSFGANTQTFCHRVLGGFPSVIPGMDIEFDDQVDGRHKYCQVKAGPDTINSGDPDVIMGHFKSLRNLARTNGMPLNDATDCCVAVLSGEEKDLNGHYMRTTRLTDGDSTLHR